MTDLRDELRAHAYITTYTGARFSYENPGPFRLADIAHSLSLTARFRGHTQFFYSVAQHSLMVSEMMRQDGYGELEQAAGLLHDAHEAYVGDIPTPLKWACPEIAALEERLATVLRAALLPRVETWVFEEAVKPYDTFVLHMEAAVLLQPVPAWVLATTCRRPGVAVHQDCLQDVELRFLRRAAELGLV